MQDEWSAALIAPHTSKSNYSLNARPPMALALPRQMKRDSARPAGNSISAYLNLALTRKGATAVPGPTPDLPRRPLSCRDRAQRTSNAPLAVILIVPMCLVALIVGVVLRGQDNNILTQVGFWC